MAVITFFIYSSAVLNLPGHQNLENGFKWLVNYSRLENLPVINVEHLCASGPAQRTAWCWSAVASMTSWGASCCCCLTSCLRRWWTSSSSQRPSLSWSTTRHRSSSKESWRSVQIFYRLLWFSSSPIKTEGNNPTTATNVLISNGRSTKYPHMDRCLKATKMPLSHSSGRRQMFRKRKCLKRE